jgi:hypothetical protein
MWKTPAHFYRATYPKQEEHQHNESRSKPEIICKLEAAGETNLTRKNDTCQPVAVSSLT